MKNNEINKLSIEQVDVKINSLKKDLFNIRFRKIHGQTENTSKVAIIKKDIARLFTKKNKK